MGNALNTIFSDILYKTIIISSINKMGQKLSRSLSSSCHDWDTLRQTIMKMNLHHDFIRLILYDNAS